MTVPANPSPLLRIEYVYDEAQAVGVWTLFLKDGSLIRLMPDGEIVDEPNPYLNAVRESSNMRLVEDETC